MLLFGYAIACFHLLFLTTRHLRSILQVDVAIFYSIQTSKLKNESNSIDYEELKQMAIYVQYLSILEQLIIMELLLLQG